MNLKKSSLLNSVLLAGVVVGVFSLLSSNVPSATASAPLVRQSEDCGDCEKWPGYGDPEHYFSTHHTWDGRHDCEPDGCHLDTQPSSCVIHPRCIPPGIPEAVAATALDVTSLASLVADGDAEEIYRRVDLLPSLITVNDARSALQLMDCSGKNVVAHIPVDMAILAALEDIEN